MLVFLKILLIACTVLGLLILIWFLTKLVAAVIKKTKARIPEWKDEWRGDRTP